MKTKISRLHLLALRNSEYPQVINHVVRIAEKYNPETMYLGKSLARLKSWLPELEKIRARELSNVLSNRIQAEDAERDTLITFIPAQVKILARLHKPEQATHISLMEHLFHTHGTNIAQDNYTAETERIKDLLQDYDVKPELKEAAEALSLAEVFEELREANKRFAELFAQRASDKASTEVVDVVAIRNECNKAVTNFLNAIEFYAGEHSEFDYHPLAHELNDLLNYYKAALKARATRRKTGKSIETEEPIAEKV